MHIAHIATPYDTPPPLASDAIDFSISMGTLAHINDPQGRRIFEAWATLSGIDWQDEEISPDAFNASARDYLARNPVILWDHKRYLPIGRCLSLTFTEQGIYVKGEILRGREIAADWANNPSLDGHRFPGAESIGAKCDEVWNLILQGIALGVSVSGSARMRANVYGEELGRVVSRVVEALLREISITPIAVHPGAKIVAANTFAKALELTKALELRPIQQPKERGNTMKIKKEELIAAQQNLRSLLNGYAEQNDGNLPDEWVEEHQDLQKALVIPEVQEDDGAIETSNHELSELIENQIQKALNPMQEENEKLRAEIAALKGEQAPIKNRVTLTTPEGSQVKPMDAASKKSNVQKALELASDPESNQKLPRHNSSDLMALYLLQNRGSFHLGDGMEITPGMKALSQAAAESA